MVCLGENKENNYSVEQLARRLSQRVDVDSGKYGVKEELVDSYKQLAYYLLANNDGMLPEYNRKGEKSALFSALMDLYGNDESAAITAKAYIYTPQFLEKYGKTIRNEGEEPDFTTIEPEEFKKDVDELFPNCGQASKDSVDLWLTDLWHSQVFGDSEISGYSPAINVDAANSTIIEDCEAWVVSTAQDRGYQNLTEDDRVKLRREYYTNRTEFLFNRIKERLLKHWGLKEDEFGIVKNPLDEEKFKNSNGFSLYDVYEFRCSFLNTLNERKNNLAYTPVVIQMFKNFLRGSDIDVMTENMLNAYIDLYKDSELFKRLLNASGILLYDKDGKATKESVSKAIADIKKTLSKELYDTSNSSVSTNPLIKGIHQLWKALKWLTKVAFYWSYQLHDSFKGRALSGTFIMAAGVATSLWVIPSINIAIPIFAGISLPLVFKYANKQIEQKVHIGGETAKVYHETVRDFLLSFALNKALGSYSASGEFLSDESTISSIMFEMNKDATDVMLYRILLNIDIQIKSAVSRVGQQLTTSTQLLELQELKSLCQEALRQRDLSEDVSKKDSKDFIADEERKRHYVNQFAERYLQIAEQKLADSKQFLDDTQKLLDSSDIDQIDVRKLMRIKTDVIGAYSIILPRYIFSNSSSFGFRPHRIDSTQRSLAAIKDLFTRVLDQFVTQHTENFLGETAYKTIYDGKARDRISSNMRKWFESNINNGNLSVFDRTIFAPRTSTSPVVRMVHLKLAQMETMCLDEAGRVGAILEDIRTANRSMSSRSFFNPMNKYAERTKDGKFTGNFISPINLGQYDNDYHEIRELLKAKHGITTLQNGDYVWDDGKDYNYNISYTINGIITDKKVQRGSDFDRWQAYETELILWQAGADLDANGNFVLRSNAQPRVHRRYKYLYYLDKVQILGRDGVSVLSDLNRQIAEIHADCMTKITWEKDGVEYTKNVPIISKLPKYKRLRLASLLHEKKQLSSLYEIRLDTETMRNVIYIGEKTSDAAKKQARKFYLWELKKHSYYKLESKPNTDLWNATRNYLLTHGATPEEIDDFDKTTTMLIPSKRLTDILATPNKLEYDIEDPTTLQYLDLVKLRRQIRQQILSANKNRTPDLKRLGDYSDLNKVKLLWMQLVQIDQDIYDLKNGTNGKPQIKATILEAGEDGEDRFQFIEQQMIPLLDNNGEETNKAFKDYLFDLLVDAGIPVYTDAFKYMTSSSRNPYTSFFKYERVNVAHALGLSIFLSEDELYETVPIGVFSDSESDLVEEKFDNDSDEWLQVNGENQRYDNRVLYNKIKDDKIYQALLEVMNMAWDNYEGFTRKNKYQLPQRLASVSSAFGRSFITKKSGFKTFKSAMEYSFHDLYRFNDRDVEVNNEIIKRADGTTVEIIPSRWIRKLDDPNLIDTDLISSVIDFYNESLRFKYRSRMEPVMEAMYFKLTGGYSKSSDAGSNAQANVVREEMSRALYGRNMTGFGENGRIDEEDAMLAKWSKGFRSLLHKRLMAHNWLSVLKNGYDSFCNLLTAAYTGKYILTQNILRAIGRLFIDPQNRQFTLGNQLLGINRSKATNMTLALMQLNGINSSVSERFRGQTQWYLRRMLNKSATLEFEFVDYTSKSIITEAVYDAYRLVYNPTTRKYEFMNENQAEYAYENRKDGWNAWNAAKEYTLRSCYYQDKKTGGTATLKDKITIVDKFGKKITLDVIDLVRPQSKISIADADENGIVRSRALETQIRTTISQMCQTINGMLNEEDKNALAKNYAGAMLVSFRGWMVSQSSEFYKRGTDFYNSENEGDTGQSKLTLSERLQSMLLLSDKLHSGLDNLDYDGQFNFATGTIDKGLHIALTKNLFKNWWQFAQMMLIVPEFIGDSKTRHLTKGKMSQAEFYQLRNVAAATDFFLLTVALTAMAFTFYNDGDGDDDKIKKQAKSLIFTTFLASISERFPQLGVLAFLGSVTDLVKAATVAVTLFDDAHYLLDAAMNVGAYADNILTELGIKHEYSDEVSTPDGLSSFVETLSNGSFKGETKAKRDFVKALALFNVDTLPILLAMDAATSGDWASEKQRETLYRDYNLNYRKNTTENAQKGLRKFYRTIVPTSILDRWFDWSESSKKDKNNKNVGSSTTPGF